MNVWKKGGGMTEGMSEWGSGLRNKWMDERKKGWMEGWMSQGINKEILWLIFTKQ